MSEWKSYKLNELADIIMGQSPPSSSYNEDNLGLPFLQGCADFGDTFPIAKYFCTEPKKTAPLNSVLISVRAPVGLTNLANKSFVIGRGLAAIIPTKSELKFLFYLINHNVSKLNVVSQGSTFSAINSDDLNNFELEAPLITEQRLIAQILSTIDSVIEKTQSAIDKYKAIKQGMLQDLFTRGIDIKTGKLRPRYEDAPELYKESKLGWIPNEWNEGNFIDFADEKISHSFTGGPFGSDLQTKHYTATGVRIIQLQNIGDGVFNDEYKIYTSEEKANQLSNCNIFPGEIILSKMADPIARACIIPDTESRFLMASDGIRLAIDKKKYNSRFVLETINHKRFRNIAELKSTGSTRSRIGLAELKIIPIVYPIKDEQDLIGLKLDTIVSKTISEEKYLSKLIRIKSGLMSDLLSGKKRVKVDSEDLTTAS